MISAKHLFHYIKGRRAAGFALLFFLIYVTSCHKVDNTRIPPAPVRIEFANVGMWNTYGVGGALDYRIFIKESRLPSGFPYTALTYTGFGGVLLACDVNGTPVAYDLACPVECKSSVRINIIDDAYAECPVCHSTYEVFTNHGHPLSGLAAERGYGLTVYSVVPGSQGEYMLVLH